MIIAERDVIVIGGGPAGYVTAIRAAQLGAKVTLVEKQKLGGACLNRACIPTKFLLRSVELYQSIRNADQYGMSVTGANIDLVKLQSRKNAVISDLLTGINDLMAMNNIEVVPGSARLAPSRQVEISPGEGLKQTLQARKVIIATGSTSSTLPIPGADGPDIMDAEKILNLDYVPKSLIMIGGGVVGVELAIILAKLGCKVSLVEIMPHILPNEDAQLTAILERALKRDGIQIYTKTRVNKIEDAGAGKQIVISVNQVEKKLEAEAVAITVGQRPYVTDLGLDDCGIAVSDGRIKTNEHMETSVAGIYAAGDVTGRMMLAYVAMAEGRVAAENALGRNSAIDYRVVPRCVFSLPEIASVGLTEDEATNKGYEIRCGRFRFSANSMATILGETRGMVKIITEQKSGQVLGVHIIGPGAVDLIAEAALAMQLGATARDIKATMHAHPTLSEALWEAALDVDGEAIHFQGK